MRRIGRKPKRAPPRRALLEGEDFRRRSTEGSMISPKTDHRPMETIFTSADVPSLLSGAITRT